MPNENKKKENKLTRLPDGSVFEYPPCEHRIMGGHCGDGFEAVNPNLTYVQRESVYLPCQVLCVHGLCKKAPVTANLEAFKDAPVPDCGYRFEGKCLKVKGKNGGNLECILCLTAEICYEGWS